MNNLSSSDIRKIIRLTAAEALEFVAENYVNQFRLWLKEKKNEPEVISEAEMKEILAASARYYGKGGV